MTTAPAITGSAYPRQVEDLLPDARELARQTGETPSRNALMREFKIGAPKADALRAELVAELNRRDPWELAEQISDPVDAPLDPEPDPIPQPSPDTPPSTLALEPPPLVDIDGHPGTPAEPTQGRQPAVWPVVFLALPAFVAVWSGWVGLGRMTGFGMVDLLPGIVKPGSWATIDSAITLPVGVETYAAYALYVWLSGRVPARARNFAKWSAIASLAVGALGQIAYHLLVAAGVTGAPWQITTAVSCLPVAVLGMGAALAHLVRNK